jgi:hypothetical protein
MKYVSRSIFNGLLLLLSLSLSLGFVYMARHLINPTVGIIEDADRFIAMLGYTKTPPGWLVVRIALVIVAGMLPIFPLVRLTGSFRKYFRTAN